MPIVLGVESRTRRGRLVLAAIIAALLVGAVTMVYPFAVMVSGALRSEMDEADLDLVPAFLADRDALYRKFLETKYNNDVALLNGAHRALNFSFRDAAVPGRIVQRRIDDLRAFLDETRPPRHWQLPGGMAGAGNSKLAAENLRRFRDELRRAFDGDLAAFARDTGAPVDNWETIVAPVVRWLSPQFDFSDDAIYTTWFAILEQDPWPCRQLVSLTQHFLETMVFPQHGRVSTESYNAVHARKLRSFQEFSLPRTVPPEDQPAERREWIDFVRNELNCSFVVLDGSATDAFRSFLRERYGTADALNRAWLAGPGGRGEGAFRPVRSLDEIELPRGQWLRGARRVDYAEFLHSRDPAQWRLVGPEFAWRDWLKARYGTVEALNAAHETELRSFDEARMPVDEMEYAHVLKAPGALRWTYATRNFRVVMREMLLRGRAMANTAVLCIATVALTLLVNPLAAYAMSRFRLRGTYKVLLLMMVTMAFPPMVTAIPTFIMLRKLELLNTFAALILPFIANGYQIFLLKGFFDSLPRELYESATIDGASEARIFFQITMALSKPILAVVALGAFTQAYTMFLFPLIVCPRTDMWTINVWLFQWQATASTCGVFAALLIASIPTLLVFVLAQNYIIRGIVVPVEK